MGHAFLCLVHSKDLQQIHGSLPCPPGMQEEDVIHQRPPKRLTENCNESDMSCKVDSSLSNFAEPSFLSDSLRMLNKKPYLSKNKSICGGIERGVSKEVNPLGNGTKPLSLSIMSSDLAKALYTHYNRRYHFLILLVGMYQSHFFHLHTRLI